MTRWGSLLAAAAAAVLVLAACDPGSPGPNYSSVSPTPSTSAAPTTSSSPSVPASGPNSSPGEVAPTLPDLAEGGTAEAAQAFEAYYIKTVDWVYATSQPRILLPFYANTCTNCTSFASNLQSQVANNHSYRGSRISIQKLALVTNDGRSGAGFAVSVEIAASALQIVDGNGQVVTSGAASTLTLTNWLRRDGSTWVIVDQGKA